MGKLFLTIRLNEVHSFIIDAQHTISHHSSLSSIPNNNITIYGHDWIDASMMQLGREEGDLGRWIRCVAGGG
ncbi:hypothetical protein MTR_2g083890 [Medicago truncatula]|uniref:Uncharacterized protein n=1 Tax=Medicago truncatula TaxID=3880 RepID=G7IM73_MEDTR|nr:hypothetical protein MTR_2g083890 [Medicago truncatula]